MGLCGGILFSLLQRRLLMMYFSKKSSPPKGRLLCKIKLVSLVILLFTKTGGLLEELLAVADNNTLIVLANFLAKYIVELVVVLEAYILNTLRHIAGFNNLED